MMGRRGMSDAQKRELWERWKAGESVSQIGRALVKPPGSVFTVVKSNGGYVPAPRVRRRGALTLADREEISRGMARGDSIRQVARLLGRPPSTVSREIARNKGVARYRAVDAEDRAWQRPAARSHASSRLSRLCVTWWRACSLRTGRRSRSLGTWPGRSRRSQGCG
jgi:hypothetical protein